MDANSPKTLWQTLNKIIDVKTSDINTARRCRLLNILLVTMLLLTLLSLITIYIIELFWAETLGMKRDENLQLYLWIWGILAGYVFFYFLNRKFPNGSAGFLFLIFLQIAFAFSDEPAQLIDGRSLYVFTIPILLSSVLIRPYFSFIFAGLTILELNLLAFFIDLPPQPIPYFSFVFLALIAWLSASAMEKAIKDLQALNLELDLRVAERTQDLLEANNQLQREMIEREQAEETVRQYADIVNTMQVGMYIVQAHGAQEKTSLRIAAVNPAALVFSGRSIEDSIGQPITGMGSIFNAKYFEQKCLAVIHSGIPTEFESILNTPDGDLNEAHNIKIFPLTEESAGILFESILEKKLAEEQLLSMNTQLEERVRQRTRQLETTNRELEAFSYTVSHDLRSPLRAINGYSNILIEDFYKDLPAPAQSLLGKVIASAAEMSALIDGLLSFSRTSRVEIRRQVIDTNLLVAEAWEIVLVESSQERQIKFECTNLPPCKADPILLRQVFINLLSNAVKYSRNSQPAFIQVDWLEENNKVVYAVRDNGVGFDMVYANKLFGVFQRLHHADEFEGTGIGLATSKRIITRHGGKIWAESELGKGATFYFTLGGSQISAPLTEDFTPVKTA